MRTRQRLRASVKILQDRIHDQAPVASSKCAIEQTGGLCASTAYAAIILPAMKRKPIQVHHFTLRDEHIELHNLLKIVGVADSGGQGQGAGRCGYSASGRCAGIAQDGQDPRRAKGNAQRCDDSCPRVLTRLPATPVKING